MPSWVHPHTDFKKSMIKSALPVKNSWDMDEAFFLVRGAFPWWIWRKGDHWSLGFRGFWWQAFLGPGRAVLGNDWQRAIQGNPNLINTSTLGNERKRERNHEGGHRNNNNNNNSNNNNNNNNNKYYYYYNNKYYYYYNNKYYYYYNNKYYYYYNNKYYYYYYNNKYYYYYYYYYHPNLFINWICPKKPPDYGSVFVECFHFEARHCQRCKRSSIDLIRRTGSQWVTWNWARGNWNVGMLEKSEQKIDELRETHLNIQKVY